MTLNFHRAVIHLRRKPQRFIEVWYIVRDGKTLRVEAHPEGKKVVRAVIGKKSAAEKILKRMKR